MKKLICLLILIVSFSSTQVESMIMTVDSCTNKTRENGIRTEYAKSLEAEAELQAMRFIQQIRGEHDYSQLLDALIAVESKGNARAVNKSGTCCGVLQITPILVREVNAIMGYKRYSLQDRFDREKSIEMFYIMQAVHNPDHDLRRAVSLWNRGDRYYRRVMKHYNETQAAG